MARNAADARKRKQKVKPEDLSPGLAEGLTQGMPAEQALRETYVPPVHGDRSYMNEDSNVAGTRVPRPRFVAEEDADSVWLDEPTGRLQKNVNVTFTKEVTRAIQSGRICLRCLEPQPVDFPDICMSPEEMGCTYPIRDRQIMDFAMEFEGEKHLGPAKPISEYMAEQEERVERARFEQKIAEGGSRGRRKRA